MGYQSCCYCTAQTCSTSLAAVCLTQQRCACLQGQREREHCEKGEFGLSRGGCVCGMDGMDIGKQVKLLELQ